MALMPSPLNRIMGRTGQVALPFSPPLPRRLTSRAVSDAAHLSLALLLWLAGNVLVVLGMAVAAFIAVSGGDVDTFFSHVNNLASRYVAADVDRRAVFEHQLVQAFLFASAVLVTCRLPGFVRRMRRDLEDGRAQ